ncbi:hypothetical protein SDRG_05950 [Saprolegnia diclina VS20]|uniref:ABC transporter domain-containing protein n=1 Tax=Saprolegnia diclina (strain VS20) TaxID=1156394 RepID=T0RVP5_SAPDV|nr:hypothetical protein SDRG_05950 [Saprolegnia diclina VS20]EQC36498.1 hypothetical protein SDRG_05950 [Saprolegnia diclina VS20]|eukprot:XP_008609919.1 hypothetical protein SDRG_05950 [Saprolegnia diclina VS20]
MSSAALASQLSSCLADAGGDYAYYACVIASGLFTSPSCDLACSGHGSSACCDALTTATNCVAQTATASCKKVVDRTLSSITQCGGLSSAAIGAITIVSLLLVAVVAVAGLVVVAKRRATADPRNKWSYLVRNLSQMRVLVWKNMLLARKHPWRTLIESLLPLVLVVALVILGNLDTIAGSNDSSTSVTTRPCTSTNCSVVMYLNCMDTLPNIFGIGSPSSTATSFYSSGQPVFGMFFLLSYLRFVPSLTSKMVLEKEKRLTEGMRMMGLYEAPLLLSWYISGFLQYTPIALLLAVELKYGNVFPMADLATLFLFFAAFGLAIVSFANLVGVFFNKSKTAAIASVLVWVLAFLPFYLVQSKSLAQQYGAAWSAPTAFAIGINYLVVQAQRGTDVYYAIATTTSPISNVITTGDMTWYLLLDSIWMLVLGWYFQQVVPQAYGVRKHWLFLFTRDYWWPAPRTPTPVESPSFHYADMTSVPTPNDGPSVEPPTQALRLKEQAGECVQLVGLRKTFKTDDGDSKVAVHNLHVTMYAGQITAFLGHNGAGKTTTISMLTGLFPPTKGTAYVFGKTITDDMDAIRASMGVCPQHDVLYDELSVLEHLQLYAALKGIDDASTQIDAMVAEVGLVEKRHVASAKLSGGQKRKLSVAIALLGKSQVVFLDEPTSGMDPYSRRFTWNVLQRNRENRVMVLTTHFMDEADLLGDRIVILSDGRLCCAGSSLFLKQLYGTGYNLTLVKTNSCNVTDLVAFVRRFVPDTNVLSNVGAEVVLQLPTHASPTFPDLLRALDQSLRSLGVAEYGISVTTLEEVFLRIVADGKPPAGNGDMELREWRASQLGYNEPKRRPTQRTRTASFASQYFAMLHKRFRVSKRDKKAWVFMVLIPVLFLGMLALIPSINVASYLPTYDKADSYAAEYYNACAASVQSTNKCAFGNTIGGNCQCQAKGDVFVCDSSTSSCSSGTVAANQTTSSYPYCTSPGGPIRNKTACLNKWFSHCSLGLGNCNATSCCDATQPISPYYPCSSCASNKWPCYKGGCLMKDDAKLQGQINVFLASLIIVIGFAFVPASIVVFIVKEKDPHQNAKYQQLACGSSVFAYWFSIWTHDVLFMLLPVGVAVALLPSFASFQNDSASILGGLALLLTHVLSMLPLAYLFTFRFTKHAAAQTSVLVFCLVTGGLLSIISFLCRLIDFELIKNQLTFAQLDTQYLRWVYLLFPGYALTDGLFQIGMRKYGNPFGGADIVATSCPLAKSCWSANVAGCCVPDVFEFNIAGRSLLYGVAEVVLFSLWVLYADRATQTYEARRQQPNKALENMDSDVAAEAIRVMQGRASGDNVVLHKLHKQYGAEKVALHQLSLGIPKGECFGYLGINGAGKSTTLQILHGALQPTSGSVTVNGHPLPAELRAARASTGYCPQFDALHDLLTVHEELELYARLKGVVDIKGAVAAKIDQFGLHAFAAKRTQGLSGGNKRKVSTAIALLGSPTLLLLDEPSTGMDPAARRDMWDVIVGVLQEKSCSVILTTHSMEECQALCTRIGILVSGQLKCLGTAQHLKHKFGRGFTLDLKLEAPEGDVMLALPTTKPSLALEDLEGLCEAMGQKDRLELLAIDWVIAHYLEKDGSVPIDVLRQWWVLQDCSQRLIDALSFHVPGVVLVESHGEHFRFQVPKVHGHTLQSLFAWMEDQKEALQIAQYSVSDTTLEEIFNTMAAGQDEEVGVVHGLRQRSKNGSSLRPVRTYHRGTSLSSLSSQRREYDL